MCQASGVIVFRRKETGDETIIVRQATKNFGFPKGGRESGETVLQTALRELAEETGLTVTSHVSLLQTPLLQERHTGRRRISVGYYVAEMKPGVDLESFVFVAQEIDEVRWYTMKEAFATLIPRRQRVLAMAYDLWCNGPRETQEISATDLPLDPALAVRENERKIWISKTLAWLLRHRLRDSMLDLQPDPNDFVRVVDLVDKTPIFLSRGVTLPEIVRLVESAHGQERFESRLDVASGVRYVRAKPLLRVLDSFPTSASGAWSVLESVPPPDTLCLYGTTEKGWEQIAKHGLVRAPNKKYLYFTTVLGHNKNVPLHVRVVLAEAIRTNQIEFQISGSRTILRTKVDVIPPSCLTLFQPLAEERPRRLRFINSNAPLHLTSKSSARASSSSSSSLHPDPDPDPHPDPPITNILGVSSTQPPDTNQGDGKVGPGSSEVPERIGIDGTHDHGDSIAAPEPCGASVGIGASDPQG
jgi:8-oxo-dGTP pyrophosphatase MutT (NUDIX family)